MKKNVREWESLLRHAEFAVNRSTNQSVGCLPFEVFHGMNLVSPLMRVI